MRFLRRFVLLSFALFVLWFAIAAGKWLPLTTDVQRKAMTVLETPTAASRLPHNAFAALWLAQYDIPAAELDKVMAADIALRTVAGHEDLSGAKASTAEGRYRKAPALDAASPLLCSVQQEDCLAKVRGQLDAVRAFVAANGLLVDHARDLGRYDGYHVLFPASVAMPLPAGLSIGKLQVTDAALRFADGDRSEGLARACSAAATWRRMATRSDSLVVQLVAAANFHGAADLFADMLAETPADTALPGDCASAFAPLAEAEPGLCDAMKTEYRVSARVWAQVLIDADNHRSSLVVDYPLLFNERATNAMRAPALASYCTDDAGVQAEAARMRASPWWQTGGVTGVLFNFAGTLWAGAESGSDMAGYQQRLHDVRTMQQLVAAALEWRNNAAKGGSVADAPAASALPAGVTWDASQRQLLTRRAYHASDVPATFSVPLPGSRLN